MKNSNGLGAGISNGRRRAVYRRDGYACALCDCRKHLQIHHAIHRSQGGTDSPHNLITLCADCHALAHGIDLRGVEVTKEEICQEIVEYLADFYAPAWRPAADPYYGVDLPWIGPGNGGPP